MSKGYSQTRRLLNEVLHALSGLQGLASLPTRQSDEETRLRQFLTRYATELAAETRSLREYATLRLSGPNRSSGGDPAFLTDKLLDLESDLLKWVSELTSTPHGSPRPPLAVWTSRPICDHGFASDPGTRETGDLSGIEISDLLAWSQELSATGAPLRAAGLIDQVTASMWNLSMDLSDRLSDSLESLATALREAGRNLDACEVINSLLRVAYSEQTGEMLIYWADTYEALGRPDRSRLVLHQALDLLTKANGVADDQLIEEVRTRLRRLGSS